MHTTWPKGWRRVRYSQSWPKLPDGMSSEAFPILRAFDWQRVAAFKGDIVCKWPGTYEKALLMGCYNVLLQEDVKQEQYT